MNNSQQGRAPLNSGAVSGEKAPAWTVSLPAGRKRPTRDERYGPHADSRSTTYGATGLFLQEHLREEFNHIQHTEVRVSGIMNAYEEIQHQANKNDLDDVGDEILKDPALKKVMDKIDHNKHDHINQHVVPLVRKRFAALFKGNAAPVSPPRDDITIISFKTLGQTIQEEILDKENLTQAALADSVGMSRLTLSYYMVKNGGPSEKTRKYLERIESNYGLKSGTLTKFINNPLLAAAKQPVTKLGAKLKECFDEKGWRYGHFENEGITKSMISSYITMGKMPNRDNRRKFIVLEKAFGLKKGTLEDLIINPYKAKPANISHLVRKGTSENRMGEIRGHLPADFDEYPEKEQQKIVKFIEDYIIYVYDDEHPNSGKKIPYALVKNSPKPRTGNKPSAIPPKAPDNILRVIRLIKTFKTKPDAAENENREKTWVEDIAEMNENLLLRFFGSLVACGYPNDKLTFELIFTDWAIDTYMTFMAERLGGETMTICNMIELLSSLVNPELGFIAQYRGIDKALTVVPGFITQKDVSKLHGVSGNLSDEELEVEADKKWSQACRFRFRHLSKIAKRIRKQGGYSRPVFEPIEELLKNELPLEDYYCGIISQLRFWAPHKNVHTDWIQHQRDIMLFRLAILTGLRRRNLAELLINPQIYDPTAKKHNNELLRRKQRGEIRRHDVINPKTGEPIIDLKTGRRKSTYTLEIPKSAFKNRNTNTSLKPHNTIVLPDIDGFYQDLETYLYKARKDIIGENRNDTGEFFVAIKKKNSTNICYSPSRLSERYRKIIQVYGVYNEWTDRGAIQLKGMKAHRIHTIRHILATHSIKINNGGVSHAAALLFDSEEVVKKAYSAYLPSDAHAYAVNQNFVFLTKAA